MGHFISRARREHNSPVNSSWLIVWSNAEAEAHLYGGGGISPIHTPCNHAQCNKNLHIIICCPETFSERALSGESQFIVNNSHLSHMACFGSIINCMLWWLIRRISTSVNKYSLRHIANRHWALNMTATTIHQLYTGSTWDTNHSDLYHNWITDNQRDKEVFE